MGKLRDKRWFLPLVGVVGLSLLVVFAGPHVPVAGYLPLQDPLVRALTVVVLLLVWGVIQLLLALRSEHRDRAMVGELVDNTRDQTVDSSEVDVLARGFERALDRLKAATSGRGAERFLYELPWYVIIGPPGCGKTTALVRSGLSFPVREHEDGRSVQGAGGTRNCDWWFTERAVLLDTAGRYSTQDSDQHDDRTAWLAFLDLLKKHRPRRPLNGVIVALAVDEFLAPGEGVREAHARALRARIDELYQRLGVELPVYMMFTKCDLVSGFADYFHDLDEHAGRQVWGFTLPVADRRVDIGPVFDDEFTDLLARLDRRRLRRMHGETAPDRRGRVLKFVRQMASLRGELRSFLVDLFASGASGRAPWLRGVYLTSGTQEGHPIDRLLSSLAAHASFDVAATPELRGAGRSFFLHDLFMHVMFPEAALTGTNPVVERRLRAGRGIAVAACVALVAAVAAWGYQGHAVYSERAQDVASEAERAVDALGQPGNPPADIERVLVALEHLASAASTYGADARWWSRASLHRGADLDTAANGAYDRVVSRYLPAVLAFDVERAIDETEQRAANDLGEDRTRDFHEALKVYLLLTDQRRLDTLDARTRAELLAWLEHRWTGQLDPALAERLRPHLAWLVETRMTATTRVERVVAEVRRRLAGNGAAQALYARLRAAFEAGDTATTPSLHLDAALDDLFTDAAGEPPAAVVPGFFTRAAFEGFVLPRANDLVEQAVADTWVHADDALPGMERAGLLGEVLELYQREYIDTWRGALDGLRIVRFSSPQRAARVVQAIRSRESPLRAVLEAVAENTSFPDGAEGAAINEEFARLNAQLAAPDAPYDELLRLVDVVYDRMRRADAEGPLVTAAGALADDARGRPQPLGGWMRSVALDVDGLVRGASPERIDELWRREVHAGCTRLLRGRFPMSATGSEEVALRDFSGLFSNGGSIARFASTHIGSLRELPERPGAKAAAAGVSAETYGQLRNAAWINRAFFSAGSAQPIAEFSVALDSVSADVVNVALTIDGVERKFERAGPLQESYAWPREDAPGVELRVEKTDGAATTLRWRGEWGLFRWLRGFAGRTPADGVVEVTNQVGGALVRFHLRSEGAEDPFSHARRLQTFRCPAEL